MEEVGVSPYRNPVVILWVSIIGIQVVAAALIAYTETLDFRIGREQDTATYQGGVSPWAGTSGSVSIFESRRPGRPSKISVRTWSASFSSVAGRLSRLTSTTVSAGRRAETSAPPSIGCAKTLPAGSSMSWGHGPSIASAEACITL